MRDKIATSHKLNHASDELDKVVDELLDHYSRDDTQTNEQTEHIQGLWERIQDDIASLRAYIMGA